MKGSEFVKLISGLSFAEREAALMDALGSRVDWPLVEVPVAAGRRSGIIRVTSDVLALGTCDDFVRVPTTPRTAQRIADALGLGLITPAMSDAIWRAAQVRLEPRPIPRSSAMTGVAYFVRHNAMIEAARAARTGLIAGHKKDVVLCNRLAYTPRRVAIYGWHELDGQPIQDVSLFHDDSYADYSHGIRFVAPTLRMDGEEIPLEQVYADPELAGMVSGEGPLRFTRYPP